MAIDRHEVESFLYYEARLMDEGKYNEWLSLWTDDAIYWVPCNADDIDPMRHVSIIYDDRARLGERVARLLQPFMHAQDPMSRMRRIVGNVEFSEEGNDALNVESNFNLTETRKGRTDTFSGHSIYKLRRDNGSFKIASKKVLLTNNDEVIDNLTFLV
jgi:3-phenylpropionate/cinnamic acid dioxygenase small subunit